MGKWIKTKEQTPSKGQWVLVTTDDYQKPIEIMCYQGTRVGEEYIGGNWKEYEYPSWTSGHGDIQSWHPEAWMPLPKLYKKDK